MITLAAHFDGEHIVLDEPFDLPARSSLMVTLVSPPTHSEAESDAALLRLASTGGAFDFLADTAEDIYTADDGEPFNHAV